MALVFQQSGSNIEASCSFQCFDFIRSLLVFFFFFFSASAGFKKVQLVKAHRLYTERDLRLGSVLCSPRTHNTFIWELVFCR